MAKYGGIVWSPDGDYILFTYHEAAIKQAVAAEREKAKICYAEGKITGAMEEREACARIADPEGRRGQKGAAIADDIRKRSTNNCK